MVSVIIFQTKKVEKIDFENMISHINASEKRIILLAVNHEYDLMRDALYRFGEKCAYLPRHMQVAIFRYVYMRVVFKLLEITYRDMDEETTNLNKALIETIEDWKASSDFMHNIPWFVEAIAEINERLRYRKEKYTKTALLLIEKHITSPHLTVKWLADYLEISTTHLSNLFKKEMKQSVSEYIRDQKIKVIVEELKYGNLSLQEVRMKYGFSSASYFSQYFKRAVGQTPLQYMKENKGIIN